MKPLQNGVRAVILRNCLACVTPQTLGMFELNKINFGLVQSNTVFQTTVYNLNRKADTLSTPLKIKEILYRVKNAMHR